MLSSRASRADRQSRRAAFETPQKHSRAHLCLSQRSPAAEGPAKPPVLCAVCLGRRARPLDKLADEPRTADKTRLAREMAGQMRQEAGPGHTHNPSGPRGEGRPRSCVVRQLQPNADRKRMDMSCRHCGMCLLAVTAKAESNPFAMRSARNRVTSCLTPAASTRSAPVAGTATPPSLRVIAQSPTARGCPPLPHGQEAVHREPLPDTPTDGGTARQQQIDRQLF